MASHTAIQHGAKRAGAPVCSRTTDSLVAVASTLYMNVVMVILDCENCKIISSFYVSYSSLFDAGISQSCWIGKRTRAIRQSRSEVRRFWLSGNNLWARHSGSNDYLQILLLASLVYTYIVLMLRQIQK